MLQRVKKKKKPTKITTTISQKHVSPLRGETASKYTNPFRTNVSEAGLSKAWM